MAGNGITENTSFNINFKYSDADKIDNRHTKKFEKLTEILNTSIKNLADGINKETLDIANSVSKVTASLSSSADKLAQLTDSTISKVGTNFEKLNNVLTKTISDTAKNIDEDALKKVSKLSSTARGIYGVSDAYANQTDEARRNANSNLSSTLLGMGSSVNYFGTTVSSENLASLSKGVTALKSMFNLVHDFSEMDNGTLNRGFDAINKLWGDSIDKLADKMKVIEKHKDEMNKKELNQMQEKQRIKEENAIKNHEQSLRFNEETHQRALKQRTKWFDELSTKGLKTALFGDGSEGSGVLGKEIKSSLLNGIKGAFIGILIGAVFKIVRFVGKILLTPLNVAKKLATSVFSFLRKSLTSAQTFKKLIELVMLPFTLLFTLLFAPILVKLAPLLVDLVNQVVGKWDVLESAGEKIGEVLTYLFDNDQWFSFGNIIDTIINLLDELSTVALETFNASINAGRQGLEVLVDVATALIITITDKIISFLLSPECFSLMTSIGTLVGLVLYEGLKVAIVSIVPLFEGIGALISGVFGGILTDIVRYTINSLKRIAVDIFPFLAGWSEFQNLDSEAKFDNTLEAGRKLLDFITNQASGGTSSSSMTTITSYNSTTYNNNSAFAGMYSSKDITL